MAYWKNEEYYGCGLGASGYVGGVRYENTKNIDSYTKGSFVETSEKVTKEKQLEYFLITNFRMEQGFARDNFKKLFGRDFVDLFKDKIEQFKLTKLIDITNDRIRLTDEGLMLMDFVVLKLL